MHFNANDLLKLSFLFCLLVLLPAYASDDSLVEKGIAYMKNEQYEEAIPLLLQAREQGAQSDRLSYNLGIAYYKTRLYQKALQEFKSIPSSSSLYYMALFNQGLIAVKQGDLRKARTIFQQVIKQNEAGQAGKLSVVILERIEKENVRRSWVGKEYGLLLTEIGVEDKSISPEQDGEAVSSEQNQYIDLLALVSLSLFPQKFDRLSSQLTFFGMHNLRASEYDLLFTSLDIEKPYSAFSLSNEISIGSTAMQLGNEPYSINYHLVHRSKKYLDSRNHVKLQYSLHMHEPLDSDYASLRGEQHRLKVIYEKRVSRIESGIGYEYEYNQRDDKGNLSGYRTYSPRRHKLWAQFLVFKRSTLSPRIKFEYRDSLYAESDNDGSERHDERFRVRTKLSYEVVKRLRANLEYVWTRNQSSMSSYDYTRNEIVAGLEYSF